MSKTKVDKTVRNILTVCAISASLFIVGATVAETLIAPVLIDSSLIGGTLNGVTLTNPSGVFTSITGSTTTPNMIVNVTQAGTTANVAVNQGVIQAASSLAATPNNCGNGVASTGINAAGSAVGCFTPANPTVVALASSVAGGAASEVLVQTAPGTTGFIAGVNGVFQYISGALGFSSSPTITGTNISGNAPSLVAGSASSVPYSGLTGTVPTWNQNTAGTANSSVYANQLSATPNNCGAGNYATGINAAGSAVGCTSAGGGGTVTSVSGVAANGFSFTVANSTTTPTITAKTSVTGILSGNGTAIGAATLHGNTSTVQVASGVSANGDFVQFDSSGNVVDSGISSVGGTGTVTSVSGVTANGIVWSVTNPTTTPLQTISLGNITPTTVNGNTLTGAGTLNLATSSVLTTNGAYADVLITTAATSATLPAGTVSLGYINIPQNTQSGVNYTTVLSDQGKQIYVPGGQGNTITIAGNAGVAYPIGTAITFIATNASGVSIAIQSDVMTLAGTTTTGTRTLSQNGSATAIKIGTTSWIISGAGLTFIALRRRKDGKTEWNIVVHKTKEALDRWLDKMEANK